MPKNSKKTQEKPDRLGPLLSAIGVAVLTYILGSWAIDSGRITAYVLTFIGVYYVIHFIKQVFKRT